MNPKRIALIHPRLIKRGGLESRLINYIDWFSSKGCEVHVFCFKRDESLDLPASVTVHKYDMDWVPKLYRHRYFSHLLKKDKIKSKFDFCLSLGRTSCQHAVIGPGNHLGYMRAFGRGPRSLSDFEQVKMDRKAYASSETILAASKFMADEIEELFNVPKGRIKVLHPPINTKRLSSKSMTKTQAREVLGAPQNGILIGMASTGHKVKGVSMLMEVMKSTPEVTLLLAGSPLGNLPENVKHLGYLEDPSVLYRAVDATILPSIYEAFGQVVVESLVCGTPVFVSENVGAKEVLPATAGQVIPVGDARAWKLAIEDLSSKAEDLVPLIDTKNLDLDAHMKRLYELVGLQL